MGDNLVGKYSNEILKKGHIAVSTIEDHVMAMQGEITITSSTESIVSTYHDADDSEIKEVVIEDKPGQTDKPSYVQPLDVTNIETFKGYTTEIQQEKEEISAIITTTTKEPMNESDQVIEEDNPEYSGCEVEQELEKHEINERVVSSRKILDCVTSTVVIDRTVAVHNIVEFFGREKKPEEYVGQLVSPLEPTRNLACLSSSYHLVTVNEGKEKRVNGILECDKETVKEIQEQGIVETNAEALGQHINAHVPAKWGGNLCNLPMIMPSTPVLLLEDFEKMGCIQPDSADSNEGTITSTYGRRAIEPEGTIASSQGDLSQWQLIEEPKVVKLDNCEILSPCMQLDRDSLQLGNILTDDSNHVKAGSNATPIDFTIGSNQEGDTTTTEVAGFTAEGDHMKVTAGVDKVTEKQYHLQTSTPLSESSEETPLLQRVENIGSFSNSPEQHSKEDMDKSVTDISAMQCKAEAEEESEKSPLLSPRDPSGEDFRVPNHSARKIKSFQNLLTEGKAGMLSPLKEQQSIPTDNSVLVNSPSKEKQKTRFSFFTNCMCCVTPTN
jgi:hypothetical protein